MIDTSVPATLLVTPAEKALFGPIRDYWNDVAMGGHTEVDMPKVRGHVNWYYNAFLKPKPPPYILVAGSNLSAQFMANILRLMLYGKDNVDVNRVGFPVENQRHKPLIRWSVDTLVEQTESNNALGNPTITLGQKALLELLMPRIKRLGKGSPDLQFYEMSQDVGLGNRYGDLAVWSFMDAIGRLDHPNVQPFRKFLVECGVWSSILLDGVAILVRRPSMYRLDSQRQAHSENGPAITWIDGHKYYAVHGEFKKGGTL